MTTTSEFVGLRAVLAVVAAVAVVVVGERMRARLQWAGFTAKTRPTAIALSKRGA